MSRKNIISDPRRELRVHRLCYCQHLVPFNNNGQVYCVPGKPVPIPEDCPTCPLRLDEEDIPAKRKGQIRRLASPRERQRPKVSDDASEKEQ